MNTDKKPGGHLLIISINKNFTDALCKWIVLQQVIIGFVIDVRGTSINSMA